MKALLEVKQKIKNLFSNYEIYIMPVIKFALALVYFIWINSNMGYMTQLNNTFILLILALICSILPSVVTVFVGFFLIVGHCYAVGIEVAAFMLVLILFMLILFLRFSSGQNIILALTPLSFGFNVPVLLPVGTGLLCSASAALPAGCGVIIYYFIRFIRAQSQTLMNQDMQIAAKLKLMADGIVQNWAMWINLVAFVIVILIVNLIRTRAFDYAWRIAILAGGVTYVLVVFIGGFFLDVIISIVPLIVYTVVSVLIAIILEFFVFGGDYSRTERLQYEDDEYYYYVKAVPKASVTTSERSIKKINAEPMREENEDEVVTYANPIFQGRSDSRKRVVEEQPQVIQKPETDDIDFEKKLEESLKDL
ncbi:MAG: hypothetical protein SPE99_04010 [Blautia sp.]|nr:hypothetical protein [Blautia sp.]